MGLREFTVCYPLQEGQVLLGYKKLGFGSGKFAGFGGKLEPGETPAECAARELAEECGLHVAAGDAQALEYIGALTFLFPARPDWDELVHVFVVHAWQGLPGESNEMRPAWFLLGDIPFDQMWDDNRYWLPQVLTGQAGQKLNGRFVFHDDCQTVREHRLW